MIDKYKFFALFSTLGAVERKHFRRFVESNTLYGSIPWLAFMHIDSLPLKKIKNFEEGIMDAYPTIFQSNNEDKRKEKKKDKKEEDMRKDMLNTFHDLHTDLKDFLMGEAFNDKDWLDQLKWLEILKERGLKKEHDAQIKALFATVQKHNMKSGMECSKGLVVAQYYRQFVISEAEHAHPAAMQNCVALIHQLSNVLHLQSVIDNAVLTKLNPPQEGKKGQLSTTEKDLISPNDVLPQIGFPLLDLHKEIHDLFSSLSLEHYERAKDLFKKHAKSLDANDMHQLLRYLHRFVAMQSRMPNSSIKMDEMHQLNVMADHNNLFLQKGRLVNGLLGNIVHVACAVKAFQWAHQFVKKHQDQLPKDQKNKLIILCDAIAEFEKKEYVKVIDLLEQVQYDNINDTTRAKLLVICSAYEMQDIMYVRDQCLSLKRILDKKGSTGSIRAALAFTEIAKMLTDKKYGKQQILDAMEKSNGLYMKEWILEQLKKY
jgi:hypothetical protein